MYVASLCSMAALRLTAFIMLLVASTIAMPAGATTPAELHAPRLAPTTVMEKEMEVMRRKLNALAQETQRIGVTLDAVRRRELLRAHLIRLREVAVSMRAMESRMHTALDSGQIASDRAARERHAFLLEQVAVTVVLLESALADAPTGGSDCK